MVGEFDGYRFTQTEPMQRVDQGSEFYAMQSWSNLPDGACQWIGWVRDWLKDGFFADHVWRTCQR